MREKDNTTGALLSASLKSPAMFRGAEAAGSLRRQRASSTSFKSSAHNEISPAKINLPSSSLSAFEVDDRLGKGAFGVVHRARRKQDGKWYVIKTVSLGEMEEGARSEAVNEVHILASISSPYVVKYYDSFVEREELHIVMEYCNRGDLQRIIHKLKRENCRSIAEEKIWAIFVQVALGLHHLHSRQILHRDMKAANVFIHKDEASGRQQVKIGDLGVAKLLNTKTTLATTMVGTPYYLSPELCRSQAYDARSDVWSLGVLLYQCCTLKLPFDADNPYLLMTKIIEGEYEALSSKYLSTSLVKLVERLLTADPQRRPSLQNILSLSDVQAKCLALGHALPPSVPPVPSPPPPSPSPAAGISVGSTTTPKHPELASSTRPTSSSQHQVREGRERLPSLVSSPPRQTLPLAWTGADHDSPNPQLYPENAENPTSPSPTWTRGRQPSRLEASQELPAGTARGSGRVPALALPPPLIISPHSSLDRDPFSPSPSHRHHRPSTLTPASSTSPPPPPLSSSTSSARARLSSRNSFGRSTDLPAHRKALSSISDSFAPELVGLFPEENPPEDGPGHFRRRSGHHSPPSFPPALRPSLSQRPTHQLRSSEGNASPFFTSPHAPHPILSERDYARRSLSGRYLPPLSTEVTGVGVGIGGGGGDALSTAATKDRRPASFVASPSLSFPSSPPLFATTRSSPPPSFPPSPPPFGPSFSSPSSSRPTSLPLASPPLFSPDGLRGVTPSLLPRRTESPASG